MAPDAGRCLKRFMDGPVEKTCGHWVGHAVPHIPYNVGPEFKPPETADAFLRHIVAAPSQYDEMCRKLASDLLVGRDDRDSWRRVAERCESEKQDHEARVIELERREKLRSGHLPCGGCGGPHRFDTSVPSVVWNAVIRAKGISEFLCTTCILREFAHEVVSFTATLWGDGFNGLPIEMRIAGQVATDAAKISEENTRLRADLSDIRENVEQAQKHITDAMQVADDPGSWSSLRAILTKGGE